MHRQLTHANLLKSLHIKGDPLIVYNTWDPETAQISEKNGAQVISTECFPVISNYNTYPLDVMLAYLKQILESINLPVTVDLAGEFSKNLTQFQQVISKIIEIGAVGINFADQLINATTLSSVEDHCKRIKAIREAADRAFIPLFINARTNIFLTVNPADHNDYLFREAIHRAIAYSEAGADGFFAPGLNNPKYIENLCELLPIPVNIEAESITDSSKQLLAQLGVSRISYGSYSHCRTMNFFDKLSLKLLSKKAIQSTCQQ